MFLKRPIFFMHIIIYILLDIDIPTKLKETTNTWNRILIKIFIFSVTCKETNTFRLYSLVYMS